MLFLREFVELNAQLILFAYGLVFFILGLSIALQSRHSSNLALARSLSWLAAFGFTHGLYEWGDLFIPLQTAYLAPATITVLYIFQILLLVVSFFCLFTFGLSLSNLPARTRWRVPIFFIGLWLVLTIFLPPSVRDDPLQYRNAVDALARYFIGFPGSLAAAFGLRTYALQKIAPLKFPHIVRMLRLAGLTMIFYAFLSGLIPRAELFFPSTLLNTRSFAAFVGLPPSVFRSLAGLIMAISMTRAMEIFDLETKRMVDTMEQEQMLANERLRIARKLHDGTIQQVYSAGLLVEASRKIVKNEAVAKRLDRAASVLNDVIINLRQNLGELQSSPSDVPFPTSLKKIVNDSRYASLVDVSLEIDLPDDIFLSPKESEHILSIIHEALANVIKHARARRVGISASLEKNILKIMIADDGGGFGEQIVEGFGLQNMRDRARLLSGQLDIFSSENGGTTVNLQLPIRLS